MGVAVLDAGVVIAGLDANDVHHGAAAALDAMAISIANADREIARRAASVRERHSSLRLPDALVIATAIELEADHLLTTDRRWKASRRLGLGARLSIVGARRSRPSDA